MKGREGCCIFVDLGRFPLTRREIPLEGWFLFFFRRSGWINGADIVYIYIYIWMKLIFCKFFFSSVTRRLERRNSDREILGSI